MQNEFLIPEYERLREEGIFVFEQRADQPFAALARSGFRYRIGVFSAEFPADEGTERTTGIMDLDHGWNEDFESLFFPAVSTLLDEEVRHEVQHSAFLIARQIMEIVEGYRHRDSFYDVDFDLAADVKFMYTKPRIKLEYKGDGTWSKEQERALTSGIVDIVTENGQMLNTQMLEAYRRLDAAVRQTVEQNRVRRETIADYFPV